MRKHDDADRAAIDWERVTLLQWQWLQAHYSGEQIEAARALLLERGQRDYPLNVARVLQRGGGPTLPSPEALLAATPEARAQAATVVERHRARLRELRQELAQRAELDKRKPM